MRLDIIPEIPSPVEPLPGNDSVEVVFESHQGEAPPEIRPAIQRSTFDEFRHFVDWFRIYLMKLQIKTAQ